MAEMVAIPVLGRQEQQIVVVVVVVAMVQSLEKHTMEATEDQEE